ncbi:class I SAM-dependent methyltransferase [Fluviicola sp.]|uniref:class I SAM-dependent methyltransferase n=1 Tax=Fluviicola sp. TaxID=1917219 RepID=UPI003D2A7465
MENYKEINKQQWNDRVEPHVESEFYDLQGFLAGKSSLNETELKLLGDISGKRILHLQCHFGQDTISFARMGASAVGADISDKAIAKARELAATIGADATFVCCDLYDLPQQLEGQFDIVFTSYGTIGWLPDLDKWASVITHFLKPNGKFVFVEFHPVVWMFDDDFQKVGYRYFKSDPIVETATGTYADRDAAIQTTSVTWNHAMSEVITSLLKQGIQLQDLQEYDFSNYNCFSHTEEFEPGKYRIKHLGDFIPMMYSLVGIKKSF